MTWKTLNSDAVLVIKTLEFRICFGFLISDFRLVRVGPVRCFSRKYAIQMQTRDENAILNP
jgi:hypothetical protein